MEYAPLIMAMMTGEWYNKPTENFPMGVHSYGMMLFWPFHRFRLQTWGFCLHAHVCLFSAPFPCFLIFWSSDELHMHACIENRCLSADLTSKLARKNVSNPSCEIPINTSTSLWVMTCTVKRKRKTKGETSSSIHSLAAAVERHACLSLKGHSRSAGIYPKNRSQAQDPPRQITFWHGYAAIAKP